MTHASRFVLVAALLAAAQSAEARRGGRLYTGPGVLVLSGTAGFSIDHVNPDGGESATGFLFEFEPFFGGFVVRNLLIGGSFNVRSGFGELYEGPPHCSSPWVEGGDTEVGFAFELQYLFNFGSRVVPYLGFSFGPGFCVPEPDNIETNVDLRMRFPAGLLIALNAHVAINIGMRFELDAGVSGDKSTIIRVPIGFLGVNAYF
jgi:hypothetical protein